MKKKDLLEILNLPSIGLSLKLVGMDVAISNLMSKPSNVSVEPTHENTVDPGEKTKPDLTGFIFNF